MFKDVPAFSSFSVGDLDEAKKFYADTLGLDFADAGMGGLGRITLGGGHQVLVYAKEDHAPATYTVLNFPVADIEAAVADLGDRGVETIRYPGTDDRGISREMGPPIAWFADPAGNIIAVLEALPSS